MIDIFNPNASIADISEIFNDDIIKHQPPVIDTGLLPYVYFVNPKSFTKLFSVNGLYVFALCNVVPNSVDCIIL